jgi:hypothetical protein
MEDREAFQLYLEGLFEDVDTEAYARHTEGANKYGPLKFIGADTLQEALEEVLDLINYARYTAVKIKMLQTFLSEQAAAAEGSETTGVGAFVPTADFIGKGFK